MLIGKLWLKIKRFLHLISDIEYRQGKKTRGLFVFEIFPWGTAKLLGKDAVEGAQRGKSAFHGALGNRVFVFTDQR